MTEAPLLALRVRGFSRYEEQRTNVLVRRLFDAFPVFTLAGAPARVNTPWHVFRPSVRLYSARVRAFPKRRNISAAALEATFQYCDEHGDTSLAVAPSFFTTTPLPRSQRRTEDIRRYLALLAQYVAAHNFSSGTSSALAMGGRQLAPKMTPTELCEVIDLFSKMRYWDRQLMNTLFAHAKLQLRTCSSSIVLRVIGSAFQCQQASSKPSNWPTAFIDVFIENFSSDSSVLVAGTRDPATDATSSSSESVSHPQRHLTSLRAPYSTTDLVLLASLLAQHRLYHFAAWALITQETSLRSLSLESTVSLLEAFVTLNLRFPDTLEHMISSIVPMIKSVHNANCVFLKYLVKIDTALGRLAFQHDAWMQALDDILLKHFNLLISTLDFDALVQFLLYRCCLDGPGVNQLVRRLLLQHIIAQHENASASLETLSDIVQWVHMMDSAFFDGLQQHQERLYQRAGVIRRKSQANSNFKRTEQHISVSPVSARFRNKPPSVPRWEADVAHVLRLLKIETTPLTIRLRGETRIFPHLLPSTHTVIRCLGPSSFYHSTSTPTANTLIVSKLLLAKGFQVVSIPYSEWNSLVTTLDKKRYIWRLGRKAATSEPVIL